MRHNLYVLTIEPPEHLSTQEQDHYINRVLDKLKNNTLSTYGRPVPNALKHIAALPDGRVRIVYESTDKFSAPGDLIDRLDSKAPAASSSKGMSSSSKN